MPSNVLSKGDMEDVLVDYHIAKTMGESLPYEEHYKQVLYMDYVFKKHGITESDFNASLEWYSRHAEDFAKIYEKVNKKLSAQKDDINHQIATTENGTQESGKGDSVNVWRKQKLYKLTQSNFTSKVNFTIYPDSNYKERDIMLWSLRATFVSAQKHNQNAVMSMHIKYVNDSILINTRKISQSGEFKIRLQNDSLCKIKEVSGFVYYNNEGKYQQDALIIDKISLMRYHAKKSSKKSTTSPSKNIPLNSDTVKEITTKQIKLDTATKVRNIQPTVVNSSVSTSIPRRRTTPKVNRLDRTEVQNNVNLKK